MRELDVHFLCFFNHGGHLCFWLNPAFKSQKNTPERDSLCPNAQNVRCIVVKVPGSFAAATLTLQYVSRRAAPALLTHNPLLEIGPMVGLLRAGLGYTKLRSVCDHGGTSESVNL